MENKRKRAGGRPTKLTPEVQKKIVQAIVAGNYLETAAAYAGIHKSTLYDWLKRGARAKSGKYREFSDAIEKALADAEMRDVLRIDKAAADGNWQAAAWRLERKFPERWGRRDRVQMEHSGPNGEPIKHEHDVNLSNLSVEELKQLDAILAKLAEPGGSAEGSSGEESQ